MKSSPDPTPSPSRILTELRELAASCDVDKWTHRAISVTSPVDRLSLLFLIVGHLDRLVGQMDVLIEQGAKPTRKPGAKR